jgi:MFS family permease
LLVRLDARRLAGVGVGLLPAGLALLTLATWRPSLPAFVAGGLLAGAGAGVLFKGGINTVLELAPREARAEALAGFFLAAYLGLSGPIIGLGLATQYVSARVGLVAFSGLLIVAIAVLARALLRAEPAARGALSVTARRGAT